MTQPEVLDPSALDQLIEDTGGDPEFMQEIIDEFLSDTQDLIASIEDACNSGDGATAHRAAHSIKSTSASFGARAFSSLAADIESRCRDGDLPAAQEAIPRLREAYALAESALRDRISLLEQSA